MHGTVPLCSITSKLQRAAAKTTRVINKKHNKSNNTSKINPINKISKQQITQQNIQYNRPSPFDPSSKLSAPVIEPVLSVDENDWRSMYPPIDDIDPSIANYNVDDDIIDLCAINDVEWHILSSAQQYSCTVALLGTPNAGKVCHRIMSLIKCKYIS